MSYFMKFRSHSLASGCVLACVIMWMASLVAGLGCHDTPLGSVPRGPLWVVFTTANSPLPNNSINCLAVDGEGAVWMGTDSGATGFLRNEWMNLRDSLSWIEVGIDTVPHVYRKVTSIAVGKDRSLWFGLAGGGVKRWNRFALHKPWQSFWTPDLSLNVITSAAADQYQTGDVWIGTVFGLSRFVQSQFDPTQGVWMQYVYPELPSSQIYAATVDFINGCTYVGTGDGLAFIDPNLAWHRIQFPPAYEYPIVSIAYDLSNTVWLGKWMGLTSVKNNFYVTHYTTQNTQGKLPWGAVNAVATDLHSDRWFGTNYGLAELNDTTWSRFDHTNAPLPSDVITALVYDKWGNLWIGTTGGVAVYNPIGTKF